MKPLFLLLMFLYGLLYAQGQGGSLDPSFAGRGWTTLEFNKGNYNSEEGRQVLPQIDGSFIVLFEINGYAMLSRYSSGGTLDKGFGAGGFAPYTIMKPVQAVLQNDGKIIVAGYNFYSSTDNDFVLARYNGDGSLDKTFGSGGRQITDFGSSPDIAAAVALQSDGKIVVAGYTFNSISANNDFALTRYNSDGSPDDTFGNNGRLTADLGADDKATAVAVQNNGKIVVAGYLLDNNTFDSDFALARYNTDGSPDNTFGNNGRQFTGFNREDYAYSLALQSDGKMVAAGYTFDDLTLHYSLALARYTADGNPDNSFDADGRVTAGSGSDQFMYSLAIQNDGKILAAGYGFNSTTGNDFILARFNSNGKPDNDFGSNGSTTTDFGADEPVASVAIQSDGKIVVAGTTHNGDAVNNDFALARYNSDGSPDNNFDGDGRLLGHYPAGSASELAGIAVQSDGKVIVAGYAHNSETGDDMAIARYNRNGSLDDSFGNGGRLTNDFASTDDQAFSIAVQNDGKIVVAGSTFDNNSGSYDFALARYNSNGSPDASFGNGGYQNTDFDFFDDKANAVIIQSDGKIVVAGYSSSGLTGNDIALARYNANGTPDLGFDGDGKYTADMGSEEKAVSLAVQSDGKIVMAGNVYNYNTGRNDLLLARYNADGSPDISFGGNGMATAGFSLSDHTNSLVLQSDGKMVVAGFVYNNSTGNNDFALARFNSNGSPDATFDGDGMVTAGFGSFDNATSVALQGDGKIVVTGNTSGSTTGNDFALARFNSDGSPDNTFNANGKTVTDFGDIDYSIASVLHDNRLYVAGRTGTGFETKGLVAAYLTGCALTYPFYRDADSDGYGDPNTAVQACAAPAGYVADPADCRDNDATIYPNAPELCDGKDNDCNGQADEGCPVVPVLNINDVTVYESDGEATLTVSLNKASDVPIIAAVSKHDITATGKGNQADYHAASGTVTIAAGSLSAQISIAIKEDGLPEQAETFGVRIGLSREMAQKAVIGDGSGLVTIRNGNRPDVFVSKKQTQPGHASIPISEQVNKEKLSVTTVPNPTRRYFILQVQSGKEPVSIRISDVLGRVMETRTGVSAGSRVQIGQNYRPGVYYAVVVQGKERVMLKLVKQPD